MTSCKKKSAPYAVGYGKPPVHTRFRKGRSGNPGGRPRQAATERAKALALQEAYRTITVKEGGRARALPAIQAVLRSQIALAAEGNVQAQRAVLTAIQTPPWTTFRSSTPPSRRSKRSGRRTSERPPPRTTTRI